MIRINLLPGQQKRRAGARMQLPSFGELFGKVKDPLLLGVIGAWVVAGAVVGVLFLTQAGQMAGLRDQEETARAEARRFRTMIGEKRRSQDLRDSLQAELEAIRGIDADRYVWPHVMEEITKALPDFTWLVSVDAMAATFDDTADSLAKPPVRFSIDGRTSDLSAYTRFVSQLAGSPWVRNAEFGSAQQILEDDQPMTAFTVTVTFQTADSAFIRTAPVRAPVR
jgi:Tfp pilus assembly protein PilN